MATIQLGRVTSDADVAYSGALDHTIGELVIGGTLSGATAEEGHVARANLGGLRDGQVIPIIHSGDPDLDGWYRVRRADVSVAVGGVVAGHYTYRLALERVGRDRVWQSRLDGVNLDAAAEVFHAYPGLNGFYVPAPGSLITRTLSDTTGLYVALDVDRSDRPRWAMTPAEHYRGAATLKWAQSDAGALYTRVGRDIPGGLATQWEISNGLVRLQPNADSKMGFELAAWDGGAWAEFGFHCTTGGGTPTTIAAADTDAVTVIRNDPEEVTVRWETARSGGKGAYTLTVSVRRGSRFAKIRWSADEAANLGVFRTATDPATAATNYIHDSTTGAARWMIGTTETVTNDLVEGGLYLTAPEGDLDVMVGIQPATPGGGDTFDEIRNQWYGDARERSWPRRAA